MEGLQSMITNNLKDGESFVNPLNLLHLLTQNLQVQFWELPQEAQDVVNSLFKSCKTVCPHCHFAEARFRYLNNKRNCRILQPRFQCPTCQHCFTVGSTRKRNYKLKDRFQPAVKRPKAAHLSETGCTNLMANSDYSAIPNLQDIAFGYGFQLNQGERLELECSCCIEGESQIAGSTHLPHLIDVNDFGAHALHPCKHIQEEEKYQAVEEICNYFDGPGSDLLLDDSAKISDGGASDFIAKLVEKYNENLDSAWETEYFE